jgi:hypothetical protein
MVVGRACGCGCGGGSGRLKVVRFFFFFFFLKKLFAGVRGGFRRACGLTSGSGWVAVVPIKRGGQGGSNGSR